MATVTDYARLGITFDTTQLRAGLLVLDQVGVKGQQVGAAADVAGAKLSRMGMGAQAAVPAFTQATASANGLNVSLGRVGAVSLSNVASMQRLGLATRQLGADFDVAATKMRGLNGAVGGLGSLIGFQLMAQIAMLVAGIGAIPVATARAQDSLVALRARLKFAFGGSSEIAEMARGDIIQLSRSGGQSYSQLSQNYADLAIAGRGAGLTHTQITGLTRAFDILGRGSGSRPEEIGRAQWQFQQALALGRLQSQDYRLMATAIPTIDDALAAGLGVSPNRIPQMVGSGEITAQVMVEALIRGVEELQQAGLDLPETMATARMRMVSEWELLMEQMGEAMGSSGLVQGMTNAIADMIRNVRLATSGQMAERAAADLRGLSWTYGPMMQPVALGVEHWRRSGARATNQNNLLAQTQAWSPDWRPGPEWTDDYEALQAQQRRSDTQQFGRGFDVLRETHPLQYQRNAINQQLILLNSAIDAAEGASAEPGELADMTRRRDILQAQMDNLATTFGRMTREARAAFGDLSEFGAGAGFSMAQRARQIAEGTLREGDPASQRQIMDVLFQQQLVSGFDRTQAGEVALAARRRFLGPAAGQGGEADRLARIELALEGFAAEFGPFRNDERFAPLLAAERRRLTDESNLDLDLREGERAGQHRVGMDLLQRRLGVIGDPAGLRRLEREGQIEAMRRDTRSDLQGQIEADMRERWRAEDAIAIRERAAADEERLRSMREQLDTMGALGREGRIQMAQLQREQELRRLGLNLTEEQLQAERQRVALNVEVSEQLDLQAERLQLLNDSARAAGASLSGVIHASIEEGVRTGVVSGEAALDSLAQYAGRILNNMLDALWLRPLENRLTEMAAGFMERRGIDALVTGRRGGKDGDQATVWIEELGEASGVAAQKLAEGMVPAVADTIAKTTLSTTATSQEAAASAALTKTLYVLSAAAAAATEALIAMAATAGVSGVVGGYNGLVVQRYGLGGVRATPQQSAGVLWGEAGAEAILPLKRGPDGVLGVQGGSAGGGETIINVYDQRGAGAPAVEQRETRGPDGERQIELYIRDKVAKDIARGEFDAPMRAQYGSARTVSRR